jgi:hypothetical protein
MITRASGFGFRVCRFSKPPTGVAVIAMADLGQDTTRCIEDPPRVGELGMLVPSVAVGVYIDCRCEADRVEVTR